MRKGKLYFIVLFLVLIHWPNPALSHTYLFPVDSISVTDIELKRLYGEGNFIYEYMADVYYPDVNAVEDAFPIVAVLQGAGMDKGFYSGFGT